MHASITLTYCSALYNLALLLYQKRDCVSALKHLFTLFRHCFFHNKDMLLLGATYIRMNQLENTRQVHELSILSNAVCV